MILPDTIVQDLRYGARMMSRNVGFTAVAVLALALGIGVNTAVFTAYKAMVARSLDARDPGEMVNLALMRHSGASDFTFSYPVPGELLIFGEFRHFAFTAVARLAGPAAFVPSWPNPSARVRDTQRRHILRQVTSSLSLGGITQPSVFDTGLGSEIAIDKTGGARPAVGRCLVVAAPVRHAYEGG